MAIAAGLEEVETKMADVFTHRVKVIRGLTEKNERYVKKRLSLLNLTLTNAYKVSTTSPENRCTFYTQVVMNKKGEHFHHTTIAAIFVFPCRQPCRSGRATR
jgi:hypothetical protein